MSFMMNNDNIHSITMEHIQHYGEIYAKAFLGEPWNDPWKTEDAVIHVRELLESKQAYGSTGSARSRSVAAHTS